MKEKMLCTKVSCLICGMLAMLSQITFGASNTAIVVVKATVVAPPPCIINNNRPVEVEFGDVLTTRVDGVNYRVPVNYTLVCQPGASNAMKIQLLGNGAAFDSTALQTSVAALGIRLQHGTTTLPVNDWVNFTYPNQPELWAVPVMQAGVTLPAEEFTGSALMRVDYQ